MRFKAGELTFKADVKQSQTFNSPQTGAELRVLTIQFRASNEETHEQALEAVKTSQQGGVFSLTDAGDPETEWLIRDSTVQYMGNPPWGVNYHTWLVQQVERIQCELLKVGEVELEPETYREEVSDDGRVHVFARALLYDEDLDAVASLHAGRTPVEVVRVGVSDTPRSMLVAQYVWGRVSRGTVVVLNLSDVGGTKPTPPLGQLEPREAEAHEATQRASEAMETLEELLSLFEAKGLVSGQEVERVLDQGRQRATQQDHTSHEVIDILGWPV